MRWAAVAAWMALIFFLSAQSTLPDLTSGRPDLQNIAGHFLAYAGLVLLLLWALTGAGVRHAALWAAAIAVLYGISDEFHQSFVPHRHPDVFDVLTDAAGAVAGLLAWRARRWIAGALPSVR